MGGNGIIHLTKPDNNADINLQKITRGRKVKLDGYKKAIITLKKGQNIDLTTKI